MECDSARPSVPYGGGSAGGSVGVADSALVTQVGRRGRQLAGQLRRRLPRPRRVGALLRRRRAALAARACARHAHAHAQPGNHTHAHYSHPHYVFFCLICYPYPPTCSICQDPSRL